MARDEIILGWVRLMPTEHDLKQAAIDCLFGMIKGKRKLSRVKGDLCIEMLAEMREAREARKGPEWMQQWLLDNAAEDLREKRNRGKD